MNKIEKLAAFKKEFSSREGIQFNNAGRAPIPRSVAERLSSSALLSQTKGSLLDVEWIGELPKVRQQLADFLGASADEVAFTPNCATALSQAALGFPLRPEDEVLVLDQEYASNFYPWKVACERSGAWFRVLASDGDFADGEALTKKVIESIHPGIKIVALSWVQFQTGAVLDLKAIGDKVHSVGGYFVVDGIQAIGQLPFSFRDLPVDFVTGGSHKWMCGPLSQGFLAVKKNFCDLLDPTNIGCGTFNRFGTFADAAAEMEVSARKFEPGGTGLIGLFAFSEAVGVHSRVGMDVVATEIFRLSTMLREGISKLAGDISKSGLKLITPLDQRSGITSFILASEAEAKFLKRCGEEQIAIAKRGDFIRVSLHAYCTDEEVARFLAVLASVI